VEENVEIIEWRSHPVRENRKKALFTFIFLFFFWISIYFSLGFFWFIVSVLFVGGSLFPYFTLTRFRLDEEGATVQKPFYSIKKSWGQFRSFYPDRNGVLLSPFSKPSRLENFRGLYLRYPPQVEQKKKILEIIGKNITK
jgi:hypothetical protein